MPPPSCPATYLLPENTSSDKTVQFCVHPKSFTIFARKTELKSSVNSERERERERERESERKGLLKAPKEFVLGKKSTKFAIFPGKTFQFA
jgi:hypothetical protein